MGAAVIAGVNIMLVVLNLPLAGMWTALLRVPFRRLVPMTLVIRLIGVHSVHISLIDGWLMPGFGQFGWVLRPLGVEPTPRLLGFILGPAFEEYLRRTLPFSGGYATVLLTDPVSARCLGLIATLSVWRISRRWLARGQVTGAAG